MQPETKTRILDAAELLFAQHGLSDTSLRAITDAAAVNLAAVNYHFGSKEALIHAVFARRLKPVNERRLAMLDEALSAKPGKVQLRSILRAFVLPLLETAFLPPQENCQVQLGALIIRLYTEPAQVVERSFNEQMASTAQRFVSALHQAVPHIENETLYWRMNFCVGSLVHTMHSSTILKVVSKGTINNPTAARALEQMLPFLEAGFTARNQPS